MDSIRRLPLAEYRSYLPYLAESFGPPDILHAIGDLPPQRLGPDGEGYIYMTVVGSRKYTDYGKEACETLISALSGLPVVIVSGLAFGIDSIAHRAALKARLRTVAVPGSGLDETSLYPASHLNLARLIVESGGALISPFPDGTRGNVWTFPKRNRVMAGISHATFVIEANLKSGTLITSKCALEFDRDVFAVPGSIFNDQSEGPHQLIRAGAVPIACGADLRQALGFKDEPRQASIDLSKLSASERAVVDALSGLPNKSSGRDELLARIALPAGDANAAITSLEMQKIVSDSHGEIKLI